MSTSGEHQRQAAQDPADIERENEQIRADMGRTLAALERKLSPGQLLDRALGMLRDNSGDTVMKLGQSVKQNPLPLILTTVGIAWMVAANRRSATMADGAFDRMNGEPPEYGTDDYSARGDAAEADTESESGLQRTMQAAKQKVASAKARVGEAVNAAGERLHRTTDEAGEGTSARMHRVAQSARLQGQRARHSLERLMDEQPFALGALGIAIGAIIGAVLPATEREDQLLGEKRERVLDQVKQAGSRKYEEVRTTAKQAGRAAMDSAKAVVQGGAQQQTASPGEQQTKH